MHWQLVANRHVQQRTGMGRLINFGENAAHQILGTSSLPAAPVSLYHFVERIAVTAGIEQQQTLDRATGTAEHGDLVGDSPVTLAHANRIDQHHVFIAQLCQYEFQVNGILDGMHRDTQDLSVDPQLLVSTDPVTVGGDERQIIRSETHHTARS